MDLTALGLTLLIGGIAGWLAGLVMKGRGYGVLINIIVGIIGAFVGNWLLGVLKISLHSGIAGSILNAFIGAVIVLAVIGAIKKK